MLLRPIVLGLVATVLTHLCVHQLSMLPPIQEVLQVQQDVEILQSLLLHSSNRTLNMQDQTLHQPPPNKT